MNLKTRLKEDNKEVDKFTYLGSALSRAIGNDNEVNIRIVQASVVFGRLRKYMESVRSLTDTNI